MRWCTLAVVLLALPACSREGRNEPTPDAEFLQRGKDAEALAAKLLAHYGPEGLDQFTHKNPGTFEPLLQAGVLSEEDGRTITRHGFRCFTSRRSPAYSRRYEFGIEYAPGSSIGVALNHRGERADYATGEQDRSDDLAADVATMWKVDPMGRSTQEAIWAASRVFNTVKLVGMHRDRILELLGDARTRRPGGVYNFPFWPAGGGETVYRFDTGAYGWQFNVKLEAAGVCTEVNRLWIH
jgi:hypothetical protein